MKVKTFFDNYLKKSAIITICETNGDILYTGTVAKAPSWAWSERELINIDCFGELDDIMLLVSERQMSGGNHEG